MKRGASRSAASASAIGIFIKVASRVAPSAKLSCRLISASSASAPDRILEHPKIGAIGLDRLADAAAERIQHDAAAERARIGFVADDEAVARERDHRIVSHELRKAGGFGRDRATVVEHDRTRDRFGGADEQAHAGVVLERAFGGGTNLEPCVEARGREVEPLVGENVAAREIELFGAGEIQRDALA